MSAQSLTSLPRDCSCSKTSFPGKSSVAILANPGPPNATLPLTQLRMAAAATGIPLKVVEARAVDQVPKAINQAVQAGAASIMVLEDPVLLGTLKQTTELVAKAGLPAILGPREYADAGGLIAYGTNQSQLSRRAADYVERFSKARPRQVCRLSNPPSSSSPSISGLQGPWPEGSTSLLAAADELIE